MVHLAIEHVVNKLRVVITFWVYLIMTENLTSSFFPFFYWFFRASTNVENFISFVSAAKMGIFSTRIIFIRCNWRKSVQREKKISSASIYSFHHFFQQQKCLLNGAIEKKYSNTKATNHHHNTISGLTVFAQCFHHRPLDGSVCI